MCVDVIFTFETKYEPEAVEPRALYIRRMRLLGVFKIRVNGALP